MEQRIRKMLKRIRLVIFAVLGGAVLFFPEQVRAEGYSCNAFIPVEVGVSGEKVPEDVCYQVVLEAVTKEAPMPEKTVLTVGNGKKAEFGPIPYTVPEDYQYKVYQVDGKADRFTYDKTVYLVTVRIIHDGKGGLKSEVWAVKEGTEKKTDGIRFQNSYQTPHSGGSGNGSRPSVRLRGPQTGDPVNQILWYGTAAAALASAFLLLWKRLRISGR